MNDEKFNLKCVKRTGASGRYTSEKVDVTLKVNVYGFQPDLVFEGRTEDSFGKLVGYDDTSAKEKFEVLKEHIQEVMEQVPGLTVEDLEFHPSVFRDPNDENRSRHAYATMTVKLHGHVMYTNMETVRDAFERVEMNHQIIAQGREPLPMFARLNF